MEEKVCWVENLEEKGEKVRVSWVGNLEEEVMVHYMK